MWWEGWNDDCRGSVKKFLKRIGETLGGKGADLESHTNAWNSLQGHKVSVLPYHAPCVFIISFLPYLLRFHDSLLPNPLCAARPLHQGAEGSFP